MNQDPTPTFPGIRAFFFINQPPHQALDMDPTIGSPFDLVDNLYLEIDGDAEPDELDLLDTLATIITGKHYDHARRSTPNAISIGDDCVWFHQARNRYTYHLPSTDMLVRHSRDLTTFIVLRNGILGLQIYTNGSWKHKDEQLKMLATVRKNQWS
jgi:hypothetical protein